MKKLFVVAIVLLALGPAVAAQNAPKKEIGNV